MEPRIDFGQPQRLHILTLIYRFVVSLPGFVFLLLPVLRGEPDRLTWVTIAVTIVLGAVTIPWIFLYYFRFTFQITNKEVIINSGILTRKKRTIPLERIQNVEIEQRLLQRLLGIAKVRISTAGSAGADGVLESVSLETGRRVRQVIRQYQQVQDVALSQTTTELVVVTPLDKAGDTLLTMQPKQVVMAGMFRFSLFYIALFFSGLQYFDIQPDAAVDWLIQKGTGQFQTEILWPAWVLALFGIGVAVLLSWFSNIVVVFNRYYGFRLWFEGGKIHKRHGLLTLSEDTIPLNKVQVFLFRANALMRKFDWCRLELQTMGVATKQQGRKVVAPLVHRAEALALGQKLYPFIFPDTFHSVSRLTIRRAFVRYSVGLGLCVGIPAYFWPAFAWWGALALLPLCFYWALLRYRRHGFAVTGKTFFVRRGILQPTLWVIPLEKVQVFSTSASFFQRRLGLKTLHIDTAGASSLYAASVIDMPATEADEWMSRLYQQFQAHFSGTTTSASQSV